MKFSTTARRALFISMSLVGLSSVAPAQQASSSASSACYGETDAFVCRCEREIFRMTNDLRREVGKPPLQQDDQIAFIARLWSREQARRGEMSHDWVMSGEWGRQYREHFDKPSPMAGENVAMNMRFASAEDCASRFVQQWRNSPGHYGNIIDKDGLGFKKLGVGVARKADGRYYATQDFGR
jgi:uncharacterized protein YkwD